MMVEDKSSFAFFARGLQDTLSRVKAAANKLRAKSSVLLLFLSEKHRLLGSSPLFGGY